MIIDYSFDPKYVLIQISRSFSIYLEELSETTRVEDKKSGIF